MSASGSRRTAEAMRDELMASAGVSEHIAAAALGWAIKHFPPPDQEPTDAAVAAWKLDLDIAMLAYARGLKTLEDHMIDRARGLCDDLTAGIESIKYGGPPIISERLAGSLQALERVREIVVTSFAIAPTRDGDPEGARPIRFLDGDAMPLPAEECVVYAVPGALWR